MQKYVILIFFSFLLLTGLFTLQYTNFKDDKLHVIFCDVGQGDGIFIRTPSGKEILFDGGPNDAVLTCLSAHMPFWDRSIDLMFLSHPHADHLNGLLSVLDRYTVLSFGSEKLQNKTVEFKKLGEVIAQKNIQHRYLFAGDLYRLSDGVIIRVLEPTVEYLEQTSPNGTIGESAEFANLNLLITYGSFRMLLTGDSQAAQLHEAIDRGGLGKVTVLQVPHHGSRTGLDAEILDVLHPSLAVVSVGAHNRYGHPNIMTLDLLRAKGIELRRTDKDGSVEIMIDGKGFMVKK